MQFDGFTSFNVRDLLARTKRDLLPITKGNSCLANHSSSFGSAFSKAVGSGLLWVTSWLRLRVIRESCASGLPAARYGLKLKIQRIGVICDA